MDYFSHEDRSYSIIVIIILYYIRSRILIIYIELLNRFLHLDSYIQVQVYGVT